MTTPAASRRSATADLSTGIAARTRVEWGFLSFDSGVKPEYLSCALFSLPWPVRAWPQSPTVGAVGLFYFSEHVDFSGRRALFLIHR